MTIVTIVDQFFQTALHPPPLSYFLPWRPPLRDTGWGRGSGWTTGTSLFGLRGGGWRMYCDDPGCVTTGRSETW